MSEAHTYAREQEEKDGALLRSARPDKTLDDDSTKPPDPRRPRGKRRQAPRSPITPVEDR